MAAGIVAQMGHDLSTYELKEITPVLIVFEMKPHTYRDKWQDLHIRSILRGVQCTHREDLILRSSLSSQPGSTSLQTNEN